MRSELGAVRRQEQVRASGASRRGRALRVAGGATALAAAGIGALVFAGLYSLSPERPKAVALQGASAEPRRSDAPAGPDGLARTEADESDAGAVALRSASPEPCAGAELPRARRPSDSGEVGAEHKTPPRQPDLAPGPQLAPVPAHAAPLRHSSAPAPRPPQGHPDLVELDSDDSPQRPEAIATGTPIAVEPVAAERGGAELGLARADAEDDPHEAAEPATAAAQAIPEPRKALPTQRQLCCQHYTQFPVRMAGCSESELHGWTALGAVVVEYFRGTDHLARSLDGIVKLSYEGAVPTFGSEGLTMISPKSDGAYVSDHDGAKITIQVDIGDDVLVFSIVTQNLEGLCRKTSSRRRVIVKELPRWFRPHVTSGVIMVIQELALQLKAGETAQSAELDANLAIVLKAIAPSGLDLAAVTDGYTGCLIYDKRAWTLTETVVIARAGSSKYSNAYRMRSVPYPTCSVWVVNIHLRAFDPRTPFQATIDRAHIEELTNILEKVIAANQDGLYVYLAGDFNNAGDKGTLVQNALGAVQKKMPPFHLAV